ncbi:hypothetical protein NPIL_355501 [Nephila pilipes]|uniref:Uncharacterized protein n=1 Tax=Nephila pilipes TaxID=299642 RepID=A0A8X6QNK6_NEPPI|nr:hypothetical protein NPIL_355501 [Nephila pilipes]
MGEIACVQIGPSDNPWRRPVQRKDCTIGYTSTCWRTSGLVVYKGFPNSHNSVSDFQPPFLFDGINSSRKICDIRWMIK